MTIEVLIFGLAAFGFAYIAGHSKISLPFRAWLDDRRWWGWSAQWSLALVECPACLGFHFGWIGALILGLQGWSVVGAALATCGSNFILARATGLSQG